MASYTRQSTFSDGDLITAALFNDEYNQLLAAFDNATGHKHDGTVGEGPVISVLGDAGLATPLNKILIDTTNDHIEFWIDVSGTSTQQLYIADGAIVPVTDNDIDLGTNSLQFKDLYINGTANIDNLAADVATVTTADINGGNIDGTVIGATTAAAGTFTTIDASGNVVISGNLTVSGTTTSVNSNEVNIGDNILVLNSDETGTPSQNAGIEIERGTSTNVSLLWNESNDYWTFGSNDLNFPDSSKAKFGTGNDLEIYHDGSDSIIHDNGTGNLKIRATNLRILNAAGTQNFISHNDGGDVKLYHAGSQKLATTLTGIDVTGTVTSDGFTAEGDATIKGGSDVSNTGATLQLESTETQAVGSGASISFKGDDGSGTQRVFGVIKGSKTSATSGNFGGGLDFFTRVYAEANARKRLAIASNGDISFYEDTGTTEKLFWDSSAESLGIGTTSPSQLLHLSSSNPTIQFTDTDTGADSYIRANTSTGALKIEADENNEVANSAIQFDIDGSERARIDSSGNLLVGKTSTSVATVGGKITPTGEITATASNDKTLTLNRTTSFGDIAQFRKDNIVVGSIGTYSGLLTVGHGDVGLVFSAGGDSILPFNQTANTLRDNAIDLGDATRRFKDLHLGGTANFGSLSDGTITITGFVDEDNMSSNSATLLPTQQSVKAYVDSQISSAGGNGISFEDNEKASFGTSTTLEIFSNNNQSNIKESGSGDLQIFGDNVNFFNASGTQNMVNMIDAGEVRIFHNGSQKFTTTSTGIDVTGTVTSDGLTSSGNLTFSPSGDYYAGLNSTNALHFENSTGQTLMSTASVNIRIDANSSDTTRFFSVSSHSTDIETWRGTELFRVQEDGKVGIGDSSPDAKLTVQGDVLARDEFRAEVVNYANNQDAPYLIASTSGYTGATTNWNTYGFQHRIKTDSSGVPRITIDTNSGEVLAVTNNNRVGIGTTSPSHKLTVEGTTSHTTARVKTTTGNANLRVSTNNSDFSIIGQGGSNRLDVYDNNGSSTRLSLDSSGNFGIGTTSPDKALVVQGNSAEIVINDTDTTDTPTLRFRESGTTAAVIKTDSQNLIFASGGGTERVRIDSSGNVGINTSSPAEKLTVLGNQNITGKLAVGASAAHGSFDFYNQNTAYFNGAVTIDDNITQSTGDYLYSGAINFDIKHTAASQNITFHTTPSGGSTTERMRIRHDGKVGLGTSSPSYRLHLDNVGGGDGIALQDSNDAGSTGLHFLNNSGTIVAEVSGLSDNTGMTFETAGSERMRIDSSGNVGIGTTSPNAKLTVQNGIQRINSTDGSSDARIQFSMTDGSNVPTGWIGIPNWNKDALYIFGPTATANESAAYYTNSTWVFQTGNTERLRIDSNGKVGINTTSVDGILTLKQLANSDSNGLDGIRIHASTGDTYAGFGLANATGTLTITAGDAGGTEDTEIVFRTASSGSESERARITSTGRLGLNTTNPTTDFEVNASGANGIKITSDQPYLFFNDTDNSGTAYDATISYSGDSMYIGGASAASIVRFRNKASFGESARIDTSGNLLVGTTSSAPYASTSNTASGISLRGEWGLIGASRVDNYSLSLNRANSNGEIINLRKSGSTVGRISTTSTGISLGTPLGSGSGIHLVSNAILPSTSTGGTADNLHDLGSTSSRFKDLHLGGGAFIGGNLVIDGLLKFEDSGGSDRTVMEYDSNDDLLIKTGTSTGTRSIRFQTEASEVARFDASGRLGIGVTSVSETLELTRLGKIGFGMNGSYGVRLGYFDDGGGVHGFHIDTKDAGTVTSESRFVVRANSGNVGIGTKSPSATLDIVADSTNAVKISRANGNAVELLIESQNGDNTVTFSDGGTDKWSIGKDNTDSSFRLAQGGTLGVNDAIVVNSSRNVGIGETSPEANLHIKNASAGTFTASNSQLLIENNTTVRLTMVSPVNNACSIEFGDIDDQNVGVITYDHTANYMNFKTNASNAMRIDSSGNLLLGKTSADNTTAGIRIDGGNNFVSIVRAGNPSLILNRTTSDGVMQEFRRDGTTKAQIGVLSASAGLDAYFASGSSSTTGAGLRFINVTSSTYIGPCRGDGTIADDLIDLGSSSARFDDIYATNGTIQTSDRNEKQDIQALTDAEQRVATACKGLIRRYKFNSAVTQKGDDARYHFGIIAQDLQDAFTAEGLDAGDYGMFISETWTDDNGVEQTKLGVRYNELLAFIIATL